MSRRRHELRRTPAGTGRSARGDAVVALAHEYDRARREMWRAGGRTFRALVRGAAPDSAFALGDHTTAAFIEAARDVDTGFRLSRRLPALQGLLAVAKRARDALVKANIPLVMAFLKRELAEEADDRETGRVLRAEWEDMFQSACADMLVAADRFAPERGLAFSTFASWYIRGGILLERRLGPAARLPGQAISAWARATEIRARHQAATGEVLTWEQVCTRMGRSPTHALVLAGVERALTIAEEVDDTADDVDHDARPEDVIEAEQRQRAARNLLDVAVHPAERAVLEGLAGLRPPSLHALARTVRIPLARAQQIHGWVVAAARRLLQAHAPRPGSSR